MLKEHKIEVVTGERLRNAGSVVRTAPAGHIIRIFMESDTAYRASVYIDATYEGDLMRAAGVSYTVGREPNSKYGDTLNGVQKGKNLHNHRFVVKVDPFVKPGDKASGLLFGIETDPLPADGEGDHRLQAFCFRMC